MRFSAIRKGMKLFDRWWPDIIRGRVVRKTTRRVHLQVPGDAKPIQYDAQHCQFLEKEAK